MTSIVSRDDRTARMSARRIEWRRRFPAWFSNSSAEKTVAPLEMTDMMLSESRDTALKKQGVHTLYVGHWG